MLSALILARLGYPAVLLAEQPVRQRPVRHGPLVLMPNPRRFLRPQQIETELSHDVLNPARVSRHRGAKPLRRYELLGGISLLSPEYLLSFERRPFHPVPPDHYALVSYLFGLSASQSSSLVPLRSPPGYQSG